MMQTRATERVPEADVLRALSCGTVVFLHVLLTIMSPDAHAGAAAAGVHVLYQLLLWATPTFALLSGLVLFARHPEPPAPVEFWRRRAGVVLLPFLAWTAVYALWMPPSGPLPHAAARLLLGQAGTRHLYFVAMVLQFYAVFPWIARMSAGLPLRCLLLPALALTGAYQAFFTYARPAAGAVELLWEVSPSLLPAWLFYLVLGGVLAQERDRLAQFARSRSRVLLAAAAGMLVLLAEYYLLPVAPRNHGSCRPAVLLYTSAMLPLLWWLSGRLAATRAYDWARSVARQSFGVYLIHPMVMVLAAGWLPAGTPAGLRFVLILAACWTLTLAAMALLRRLPHGERLLGMPASKAGATLRVRERTAPRRSRMPVSEPA